MKEITVVTHNGSFHADDCFAVAVVLAFLETQGVRSRVVRSRDNEIIASGDFVLDVGGVYDPKIKRFDHHQSGGAGTRQNGVPYAAFGLVWKHFGEAVSGLPEVAALVDKNLVSPLDFGDNLGLPLSEIADGVYPYTINRIFMLSNSTVSEKDRDDDKTFSELVSFARMVIMREIVEARTIVEAREAVEQSYIAAVDKRIIILGKEYPWFDILSQHPEPLFVVAPDGRTGNWGVSAVRLGKHDFRNRKNLPLRWAGKRDEELARESGVPDAVFCHNRLFVAVAKSKEGAIQLAKRAVAEKGD